MNIFSWKQYLSGRVNLPLNPKRLIIESTSSRPKLHALLMYGHLLTNALQMLPVFIATGETKRLIEEHAPGYLGQFEIVEPCQLSVVSRGYLMFVAIVIWLQVTMGRSLVKITWRGLQMGDIAYDQYLAARQHARLHRRDPHLIKYIYITLRGIEESDLMIEKSRADSVLLSHRVGIWASTFSNAAQRHELPMYSYGGDHYGTLKKSLTRKAYEYKATTEDLAPVLNLSDYQLDQLFESVRLELFEGAFNPDAKLAFSKKLYINRVEFAEKYNIPAGKRNIFIMLHAFTDYPHTHFDGMLFEDYYDWFIKTLEHAYLNTSVNWIVKSHPSSAYYPARDIDWGAIENKFDAQHIVFMPVEEDFDSRSIAYVGDSIITCIGSAGFEFSAMAGLPSITAGDNPYSSCGFAMYPSTKEAYFEILSKVDKLERIQGEELRRAKATFIFIHRLSRVRMSAIPVLTHAEHRYYESDDEYFSLVSTEVKGNEEVLIQEIEFYKEKIRLASFDALRTSPEEYLNGINSI